MLKVRDWLIEFESLHWRGRWYFLPNNLLSYLVLFLHLQHSKGNCLFGELLEKVKDIMLLFGLKAADMAALAPDATNSIP